MTLWKDYKTDKDLGKKLIGRKIVEWNDDYLKLDDDTIITIEMTENDCCATACGNFKDVKLNAVITDIRFKTPILNSFDDYDETFTTQEVVFVHNQNKIAQADLYADNGNGDYYYSIVAFKIKDVYYAPLASYEGDEE